jgi:hypothetical protein
MVVVTAMAEGEFGRPGLSLNKKSREKEEAKWNKKKRGGARGSTELGQA